jgi:hypothetical protein
MCLLYHEFPTGAMTRRINVTRFCVYEHEMCVVVKIIT